MLWVLVYIVLVLAVLLGVDRWLKNEKFDKIPGPKGIFLLANSLDFVMDPVKLFYLFRSFANKYKYLFKVRLGTKRCVIIYNPEDVEVVLSGTKHNTKGFLYKFIRPWLQDGLLLSDGTKWQHRRKILTPTFHFNILKHFNVVLEENSRKLAENLRQHLGQSKTDISALISDFTLNSICETAMGIKLNKQGSDFGRRYKDGIYTLGQMIVYRAQRIWIYPDWLFSLTGLGRKQKELLNLLSSFRDSVINKRRETADFQYINVNNCDDDIYNSSLGPGRKRLAMLDLLLQAENVGTIDAKGIGEEVDTFMFEGHDTTSTALQFAFMLLANNAEVQDKIVAECAQIFGTSDRTATMSDLGQMKYLECCLKESLRLYPPVHFILRKFSAPVKLRNYEIPAGVDCTILLYDLHRRPDQYVEPLAFKPERFLVEPTWHPYSYIPFSAGPRNCIGQKFAMMEMKLAVSAVLRRYRLLPVTTPRDIVFITDFILRPTEHIYVQLLERINSNRVIQDSLLDRWWPNQSNLDWSIDGNSCPSNKNLNLKNK